MIRTTTDQTATGSRTIAQIFCDGCKASAGPVEIGSASTDRSSELAELRARTGFTELGWGPWVGGTAPQGLGDSPIHDFCSAMRGAANRRTTMNEATTETTNNGAADWAAAAAASAAANAEPDVTEKHFTEILPVKLSDREHKAAYERARDATKKLKAFDAETKALTSERKAKRAELEAAESAAGDVADTGRVEREVPCVERVSWKQNRKWRVRLDTNETYDEQALSDDERQAELPLPASTVADEGTDDEDDGDEDDDDPSFDDSTNLGERGPDASSVDVTEPQTLLDGAAPDGDGEATPNKPTRRGRKG